MIQANELRIGNWVITGGSYYNKVTSLGGVACHTTAKERRVLHTYEFVNPIPLTPEILEKAGFRHYKKRDVYGIDWGSPDRNLYLGFYSTGIFPTLVKEGEMVCDPTGAITLNKIEHLHQLQNLYFSLTGTELNIQL